MANTIETILRTYDVITVVGASASPAKAACYVPEHMQRHGWRIIPVNPRGGTILGEEAYRSLDDIPEPIGLVNVFRPGPQTPDIARQAVACGARALWLQLGISSAATRDIAEEAGLLYVEDRCLIIEQRRLGLEAPRPAGETPAGETPAGDTAAQRAGDTAAQRAGDTAAQRAGDTAAC